MVQVAIAASSRISAEAGAQLADVGGNAVDAVLGATLVSMCTDTGIMSPGGGAIVTIWPADDLGGAAPLVIEGCPEMPGRNEPAECFGEAMWEVVFDYGCETHSRVGFGSVATPGAFAALAEASRRFGRLPWSKLMQPAITWAEKGFPLRGGAAEYLRYTHKSIYSWSEESFRLLHHADGSPLNEGDTVFVPHLAESLQQIASEGVETLYGGALGQRIAAGVQASGGLLGEADLAAYRAEIRHPISLAYRDWHVATCPPPSVGGASLAGMLQMLQRCPEREVNTAAVRWLVAAQQAILTYRAQRLDTAGETLPREVERLLVLAQEGNTAKLLSAPETIHISGVDDSGLACSVTASAGYGSGAIVPGTGIWLNNSLGEVDLHPTGLTGVKPGTRLFTNMAPTVAKNDAGAVLAIGSPGASRITTAIAQTLWQHIHFGKPLTDAVAYPRLHVELSPDGGHIAYEPGLPVEPMAGLNRRAFPKRSMYFGGVQVTRWCPTEGFSAVGDIRRSGHVAFGGTDPVR